MAVFDFAPNSHVAIEKAPDEVAVTSFNGWDFTARPSVPYRRGFLLKVSGMYWRQNSNGTLDVTTGPTTNAGRLLAFYQEHRRWKTFTYVHEYLGNITCRFAGPVEIPEAIGNAGGLIPTFELSLIHHNPGF